MKIFLPLLLLLLLLHAPERNLYAQAPVPPPAAPVPVTPSLAVPERLTQLRQQYSARALTVSTTLSEQFAAALGSLAREAGALGDYDVALKAQQRRESLAELFGRTVSDHSLSNTLVLRPVDAKLSATVSYDRSKDVLLGWKATGNTAYWDVTRIVPGSYDITLEYSVALFGELPSRLSPYNTLSSVTTGGTIEFYEDSSLAGASQNRRTSVVTSTGGWSEFATMSLPAFKLTRSNARLAVKVVRANGDGGVMHLKQIRLTPSKASSSSTASTPLPGEDGTPLPPVDELTRLQQDHAGRLKEKLMPVLQAYAQRLHTLAEQLKANADSVEELQTEARRVERAGNAPLNLLVPKDRPRGSGSLPDGMRELLNVSYVSMPSNTGDTFSVSHEGVTFRVRLLWVSCPPPVRDESASLTSFTQYFKIDADDALHIGEQAREFTSTSLKDRSLRLLTRGLKDDQGNILASVQPEGLGDFAGALVDNGLALVHKSTARTKAARAFEETVLLQLRERETAARARPIPPGAWARSEEPSANAKDS